MPKHSRPLQDSVFLTVNPGTPLTRPHRNSVMNNGKYRMNRLSMFVTESPVSPGALKQASGSASSINDVMDVMVTVMLVVLTSSATRTSV